MFQVLPSGPRKPPLRIKVVAVGNAGINILDRLMLEAGGGIDCVAVNTDSQSLASSVASEKFLVGERGVRGMGTGGDPDLALAAWEEDSSWIEELFDQCDALLFLGCLGGGTAGVLLPKLVALAGSRGLPRVCIVTTPFAFEGPRKSRMAAQSLQELKGTATLLAAFPNDGMGDIASQDGPIGDAFSACDVLISGAATALLRVLRGRGPMEITPAGLLSALGGGVEGTVFSHAAAAGANRANDVVGRLMKSPLLRTGCSFEEIDSIVVQIAGGASLSLLEVQTVVSRLQRELEERAVLHLGICTDSRTEEEIHVTVFGVKKAAIAPAATTPVEVRPTASPAPPQTTTRPEPTAAVPPQKPMDPPVPAISPEPVSVEEDLHREEPAMSEPTDFPEESPQEEGRLEEISEKEQLEESEEEPESKVGDFEQHSQSAEEPRQEEVGLVEPEKVVASPGDSEPERIAESDHGGGLLPGMDMPARSPSPKPVKKSQPKTKQEVLPLDVAARGRFERSEPTIVEGEDLDIPTFVRLKLKLK